MSSRPIKKQKFQFQPEHGTNPQTDFRPIQNPEELQDLYKIDAEAYGNASIPYETFLEWWSAHQLGLVGAFDENNKVQGAIGIWPVTKNWIKDLSSGRGKESNLNTKPIQEAGSQPTENWYISGIVVTPKRRGRCMAQGLIIETLRTWATKNKISWPASLWATAYSPQGEKLLARFGFNLHTPGNKMADGDPLYTRRYL